jgi:hypothetical protein
VTGSSSSSPYSPRMPPLAEIESLIFRQMKISSLIGVRRHGLPSDSKAFPLARKRLSESQLHDMALRRSKMVKADANKAGLGSVGRQSPRHIARLVVKSNGEIPCASRRVLVVGAVDQQPLSYNLNRQLCLPSREPLGRAEGRVLRSPLRFVRPLATCRRCPFVRLHATSLSPLPSSSLRPSTRALPTEPFLRTLSGMQTITTSSRLVSRFARRAWASLYKSTTF